MDSIHLKSVLIGKSTQTEDNLALETYLMSNCNPSEVILFLWQSDHTVVIGRHQNPYLECDIERLKADGVKLVRRRSGGGAVYHDLGNLNFSFIAHQSHFETERFYQVVLKALNALGTQGEINGRNDMVVDGKKFSGSAFLEEKDVCCHHGTLLVESELQKLSYYLTPSKLKIETKGVESIRSRVVNLNSINPQIQVESLKKELIRAFNETFTGTLNEIQIPALSEYAIHVEPYKTWDWQVGSSPKFNVNFEKRFEWGTFKLMFEVVKGSIVGCAINTDTLTLEDFSVFTEEIKGRPFDQKTIVDVIEQKIKEQSIKVDLMNWMCENLSE